MPGFAWLQEITEEGVSQLLPVVPELIELQLYWNLNVSDNLLFSVAAFLENLQMLNLRYTSPNLTEQSGLHLPFSWQSLCSHQHLPPPYRWTMAGHSGC